MDRISDCTVRQQTLIRRWIRKRGILLTSRSMVCEMAESWLTWDFLYRSPPFTLSCVSVVVSSSLPSRPSPPSTTARRLSAASATYAHPVSRLCPRCVAQSPDGQDNQSYSNIRLIYTTQARLPPRATNCRKKKCGHTNQLRPKKKLK